MNNPDPLLTGPQIAGRLGISASTWRAYVSRGQAPAPDDPGDTDRHGQPIPKKRRIPRWKTSTIDTYAARDKRPGTRTDLKEPQRDQP
jgi:hypothetical protein